LSSGTKAAKRGFEKAIFIGYYPLREGNAVKELFGRLFAYRLLLVVGWLITLLACLVVYHNNFPNWGYQKEILISIVTATIMVALLGIVVVRAMLHRPLLE
jgi:hypothetical protein